MDLKIKHLQKFSYDVEKYNFKSLIEGLFCIDNIEEIHKYVPELNQSKLANDSSSIFHKIFYGNFLNGNIQKAYDSFLKNEISQILGEEFYYQKIPCFRICTPNQKWLNKFHKDSEYNHPQEEINFNIAITDSKGSAALQIEEYPFSNRYKPLEQNYGEYTRIDHINCMHGSIINNEAYTFASIDFRVIQLKDKHKAFENPNSSVLLNKKFKPGSYFSDTTIK